VSVVAIQPLPEGLPDRIGPETTQCIDVAAKQRMAIISFV